MEYEPTVYDDSRGGGWDFDPEVLQVMPELLRFDPYKNYYRGGMYRPSTRGRGFRLSPPAYHSASKRPWTNRRRRKAGFLFSALSKLFSI